MTLALPLAWMRCQTLKSLKHRSQLGAKWQCLPRPGAKPCWPQPCHSPWWNWRWLCTAHLGWITITCSRFIFNLSLVLVCSKPTKTLYSLLRGFSGSWVGIYDFKWACEFKKLRTGLAGAEVLVVLGEHERCGDQIYEYEKGMEEKHWHHLWNFLSIRRSTTADFSHARSSGVL